MNKEEIKIITLGDIFKSIETEEKAFKFLNYIKELQQENQQLKKQKEDVVEYIKKRTIFGEYTIAYPGILNQDEVRKILRMLGEENETGICK